MRLSRPPFEDVFPIENGSARFSQPWKKWIADLFAMLSSKTLTSVTQQTNKATGVTLHAPQGNIVMNNAALGATTAVQFVLTNNIISTDSIIFTSIKSGATAGAYQLTVDAVSVGACTFSLYNRTAGILSEAVSFNFKVINGTEF